MFCKGAFGSPGAFATSAPSARGEWSGSPRSGFPRISLLRFCISRILAVFRETGSWRVPVKKFLGIFALLGALVGAVMFWRRRQDDDEFLDEELE